MSNLWTTLSGSIAQQRNVETIANNVANANTPGFKRDQLVFKEHLTSLSTGNADIDLPPKTWSPDDFYRSSGAEHAFVKSDGSYTDFKQGSLRPTGNIYDFAISGPGLIEILTHRGVRYTRKGDFGISNEGQLITSNGDLILKSQPIDEDPNQELTPPEDRVLTVGKGRISVSPNGDVFKDGAIIGTISIREFIDPHKLKKEGSAPVMAGGKSKRALLKKGEAILVVCQLWMVSRSRV